jgi:hypothetical protein
VINQHANMDLTERLSDKAAEGMNEVLSLSFEYLLAFISAEYNRTATFKSVKEFNDSNNVSFAKALLYPFFVSLSNGNSKSLYTLFGDFYALKIGPLSIDLYEFVKQGTNKPLTYFSFQRETSPFGVGIVTGNVITNESDTDQALNTIKDSIKSTTVLINEVDQRFDTFTIQSDIEQQKPLYSAIESGVRAILQNYPAFFSFDTNVLKLHASYYNSYKSRVNDEKMEPIPFAEINDEKLKVFFSDKIQ